MAPQLRPLGDRQREIAFGLGLLIPVATLLALGEAVARLYLADVREVGTDWRAVIEAVGIREADHVRFRPDSATGLLAFNDRGFRGPSLPVPAPPRTVRIAFLGDSKVLSASLPEPDTLPAQTLAILAQARPDCRFDYVSLSGPGYTMDVLAALWSENARTLRPDLAVVLAGSVADVIARHDTEVTPEDPIRRRTDGAPASTLGPEAVPQPAPDAVAQSALLALVRRNLILLSPAMQAIEADDLPWDALDRSYRQMAAGLVSALDDVPVVAVAYRSRLRSDQAPAEQAEGSRHIRAGVPGLSVDAAVALAEFVPDALRAVGAQAGWTVIDPIRDIPADATAFLDATHFSSAGVAALAQAVADEVAPGIGGDCRL